MKTLMLATALVLGTAPTNPPAMCAIERIAGVPGENHVMFNGLSPDGKTLAVGWDRGSGPAVERGTYLLDLRSGTRTEVPYLNNAAAFSPDGRYLVSANYASEPSLRTEVVELDRRTGAARTFASASSGEWLPSYSPDGKWIAFNSTRSGRSDIYRVRRTYGEVEQLTSDPRYEAHATYFDRGRKLIFHRQSDGDNYDIVVRDLRTGTEHLVGATGAEEAYPAVSPDGRWIAFSAVTKPGAQPHLFVMAADGGSRRQLTDAPDKDAYAAWSADGRSIYFVRFAAAGSTIERLRLREGNCVR